ncbi:hypothetical protein [Salinilacihabitans rarus]|uniref:hypothetical protein n=1 Tax=Salinilacihabitans rarus TaxID=2961596 RepID=UPI0020C9387E|nr:hypothetical protein [Salinilacihabitans rarus]
MSTTAHTIDEVQARDEPANVFERYVFEDPSCCSSCFRRIKSDHRRIAWGTAGQDKEDHDPIPGYLRDEDDDREAYGAIASYPTRTVCDACGSIAGQAPDETLSRREAIQRTDALADRLLELGEPIGETERDELKRSVGILKSKPEIRGYDREIFSRATKVIVRRARTRHW